MGLNDTGYEGKRGVKDVSWVISLFNHFMQWERMWMESQVLLISEPWGILTLQAGKKESEKKEPPECHRPTNHGSGAPEASEETACKRQKWPDPRGQVSLVDKNFF